MRRVTAFLAAALLIAPLAGTASANSSPSATPRAGKAENYGSKLVCGEGSPLCAEANDALGYHGGYTGHDEPSLLFYSDTAGSGNESNYRLVIPTEPPIVPKQNGTGGTFNGTPGSGGGILNVGNHINPVRTTIKHNTPDNCAGSGGVSHCSG